MQEELEKQIEDLPKTSGVYIFKDPEGEIIYIGKAAVLPKRVQSYFSSSADPKAKKISQKVADIDHRVTDSVLEALILEAKLIKKHEPFYNIQQKDDKSFLYVVITDEEYPRVILKRGREEKEGRSVFGPFVSSSDIREALKIIRRIFPYNTHTEKELDQMNRPCFYYQINLCPGACAGELDREKYLKDLQNIEKFFQGKKEEILEDLKEKMQKASENQEFERAQKLKKQIKSIEHIHDSALVSPPELENKTMRLEGYDISDLSGKLAAGSMVVFEGEKPNKKEYRKFKIKTVQQSDDVAMMKEVLERRFNHDWPLPNYILVDGGKSHVNIAQDVLTNQGLDIPVVGLAKGKDRKSNRLVGDLSEEIKKKTLVKLRDEAHRFAQKYHKKLRDQDFLD